MSNLSNSKDSQQNIRCWSCRKMFTYASLLEKDGYCPHCDQPVDLEEDGDDE